MRSVVTLRVTVRGRPGSQAMADLLQRSLLGEDIEGIGVKAKVIDVQVVSHGKAGHQWELLSAELDPASKMVTRVSRLPVHQGWLYRTTLYHPASKKEMFLSMLYVRS